MIKIDKDIKQFKACGMYSEVLIDNDSLIFKGKESYIYNNRKSFSIHSLEDNKIYEINRLENTMDAFIKKDNNLIFLHIRNVEDISNDRVYFLCYDLKSKSYVSVNLNKILSKINVEIFRNIKQSIQT